MTKEELAAYEIKPISEIIPYWDKFSDVSKAVIESAFNLEWWRGYHAPRPATMRHVRMGQPAPEGDTHIILGAEDYERWREECGKLREDKARLDWLDRTPPDGQRTTAICQMAGETYRQAIDRQRRASESMFAVCEELRRDDEAAP